MSNPKEGGTRNRVDPDAAARLVSVLLTTEPDDLEGYRRRCLGKESEIALDRLRAAQELLGAIGSTLRSTDDALWQALFAARRILFSVEPPAVAPEPAVTTPAAPSSLGEPHAPATPPASTAEPERLAPVSVGDPPRSAPQALPFKELPNAPPPSALPDLEPLPESSLHGTLGLAGTVLSPLAGLVLPFDKAADSSRTLDEPTRQSGTSAAQDSAPTEKLVAASVHVSRPAPALSVEQYAWLRARCEADPSRAQALNRDHGLRDDSARRELDLAWQRRLEADAALGARFEQLRVYYLGWIAQRRG